MTACADCGGHLTLETRGEIETIFATCHHDVPVHRGIRDGWFTACDRCDAVVEVVSGRPCADRVQKEGAATS